MPSPSENFRTCPAGTSGYYSLKYSPKRLKKDPFLHSERLSKTVVACPCSKYSSRDLTVFIAYSPEKSIILPDFKKEE